MDQRGTSELEGAPGAPGGIEEQAQGEQTQGEAVQFDLFGLPVQAAPAAAPEPCTDAPKKRRAREILAAPPSQGNLMSDSSRWSSKIVSEPLTFLTR